MGREENAVVVSTRNSVTVQMHVFNHYYLTRSDNTITSVPGLLSFPLMYLANCWRLMIRSMSSRASVKPKHFLLEYDFHFCCTTCGYRPTSAALTQLRLG